MACRVAARAVVGEKPRAIAVGLSGGADSLALTAALVAEGHDVTALCVDHGLQQGSAAQARRAAEQARALGAGAEVLRVDVGKQGSVEAEARAAGTGPSCLGAKWRWRIPPMIRPKHCCLAPSVGRLRACASAPRWRA